MQRRSGRIVEVNGVDLCFETFGDPADPAIVLVHGAGNTMLSWDDQLRARLADAGRFVVRYDCRDAGQSVTYEPGAPPYTLRDLVADAVGLLDALGVDRAHVIGMSAGAAIGQLMALDYPARVASLTLVSSTPGIPGEETADLPPMSATLEASFSEGSPEPDWSDREAVIDYLVEAERPFAARSRPFDEQRMLDLAARVYDHSADIAATATNPYLVDSGEPWRPRLGNISAPTLVLHGTEDPLFPHEHGVALAREIPGARLLTMERTGHEYIPRAVWDVVLPAILDHTSGR